MCVLPSLCRVVDVLLGSQLRGRREGPTGQRRKGTGEEGPGVGSGRKE